MKLLDLTLQTSAQNLALDESLLSRLDRVYNVAGEPTELDLEVLRIWEPEQTMVVLGRSSKRTDEIKLEYCLEHQIDVLRRSSGGAAIVTGVGCLMYSVVLDLQRRPELRAVNMAHCYVLRQVQSAVCASGANATIQGTSDLTLGDRKFSGNSLRLTRNGLLYHGTLLNTFDLELIPKCLKAPPRQPEYRLERSHADFLVNLNLPMRRLKTELIKVWHATENLDDWSMEHVRLLVDSKFGLSTWNERL